MATSGSAASTGRHGEDGDGRRGFEAHRASPPEQALRPDQEHDQEDERKWPPASGRDRRRRATAVSVEAEQQAGDQRAEEIADAAHDDDDQRLHGEDHADRRVEGEEHRDQHAGRGDQRAAEREGKSGDASHVDGNEAGGGRVDGDGADRGAESASASDAK